MSDVIQKEIQSKVSWAIFGISLAIVVTCLVSLVYPGLILTLITDTESNIDPFELGVSAIPFLTINLALLVFGIMYYAKKIPNPIKNFISFMINFEVSRSVTILIIVILIGLYIGFSLNSLTLYEGDSWGDFKKIEVALQNWPSGEGGIGGLKVLHVKNFLLTSSQVVFQNIKVIPFIASISVLLLTYFFTLKISNKRFGGLVAMVILLQSHTFRQYDTLATYSNFWILFYLLSLYVTSKKWYLSPISFVASIFSKPLAAAFVPLTLFFTYRAEIPLRKKTFLFISYGIISIAGIAVLFSSDLFGIGTSIGGITFDPVNFWAGFTTFAYQLRFDGFVLVTILPLTVGLFMTSRKGIGEADSILLLIAGMIFAAPLLAALTSVNIHPYRYVPMIVFFAIGIGTLFSKRSLNRSK